MKNNEKQLKSRAIFLQKTSFTAEVTFKNRSKVKKKLSEKSKKRH